MLLFGEAWMTFKGRVIAMKTAVVTPGPVGCQSVLSSGMTAACGVVFASSCSAQHFITPSTNQRAAFDVQSNNKAIIDIRLCCPMVGQFEYTSHCQIRVESF